MRAKYGIIDANQMWNFDEKGAMTGKSGTKRVIVRRGTKKKAVLAEGGP
jgi:hypothetical protein